MSLDGVIESPEKWSLRYWNDEISRFKLDELFTSEAHLLGRMTYQGFVVTYQGFAAAWPSENDRQIFVDRMNRLPKYVVSTTLEKAEWNNSSLIKGNLVEEISRLKQQPGQDILIAGSATLIQTLRQHDLIDAYRLLVYPVVLGSGKRLFQDGSKTNLRLVESKSLPSGVVLLEYQPANK